MDKKKQITGLSAGETLDLFRAAYARLADEIRGSHITAFARLLSCDQDEDPRIEARKTDDTRYLSAAIYLLDRLEEIQEAKEIRQSPVILKVAGILTKAVSDAGMTRLGELAVLFPEDQQQIITDARASMSRIGGQLSQRPPSPTSGRALVDQWRTQNSKPRWTWLTAWEKLVESARSQSAIGEFAVTWHEHEPDQILFTVAGKAPRPLKKTSFKTYWKHKNNG